MFLKGQPTTIQPGDILQFDLRYGQADLARSGEQIHFGDGEKLTVKGGGPISKADALLLASFTAQLLGLRFRVFRSDTDRLAVKFFHPK
jgi:hypothetical protein